MGGYAIQLMRIFRLKNALAQCFTDATFLSLPRKYQKFAEVMKQDSYWELHFSVVQLLYPLYRLLRLADMRIGGMDKVKYYILQVDRLIDDALEKVCNMWDAAPGAELGALRSESLPDAGRSGGDSDEEADFKDSDGKLCCIFRFWTHLLTLHFCVPQMKTQMKRRGCLRRTVNLMTVIMRVR